MSGLNHPMEINRDYIRLLQVMRRFVQEEFAVAIRMTQEDAVEQLLHYAAISRNHVLQEMGRELREFTAEPDASGVEEEGGSPQESAKEARYYRGVVMAVDTPPATAEEQSSAQPKRPTRIYRGRVIPA